MTQQTIDPNDGDISLSIGKPHNLNVTLSAEDHEKLSRLARAKKLSKANMIRQCIDWRYTMEVQQLPLCASGQRCYVPHMHPPAQGSPHQELIPQQKPV